MGGTRQPKFGVIYKITNLVNGKVYVGKTIGAATKRWREHRCSARTDGDTHLYNAIRKYGVENFAFEVIDHALNETDLNAKESEWIARLGVTDREKGYNLTHGGEGARHVPETCAKLAKQRKEWWDKPENRTFFSEHLWDAEKRATQSESSKRWRATPEGLAATERVRARRVKIRTCPTCGESFAGVQWQAHTRRKSGCPTLPCPSRRKWAKPKMRKIPEEAKAHLLEVRGLYWTTERRAAWGVEQKARFAANEEARNKCSEKSKLWWANQPEAKKKVGERARKMERLNNGGAWTPERRAAWSVRMKQQAAERLRSGKAA